jgi:hypothetical protein
MIGDPSSIGEAALHGFSAARLVVSPAVFSAIVGLLDGKTGRTTRDRWEDQKIPPSEITDA